MMSHSVIVRLLKRSAILASYYQAITWLLIGIFGFADYPGAPILRNVLAATQVLGLHVLAGLGWCCGFGGGFVISDVALNRWGGLTMAGAPVLFVANGIVLFILLVLLRGGLYGLRAERRPA
jgi:hypothetical protein